MRYTGTLVRPRSFHQRSRTEDSVRIRLGDFADFVLATSSKKATQVKKVIREQQQKQKYNTFEDWLPVRNAIQAYLRAGATGPQLDAVIERANDQRRPRYEALIGGFREFRGKRALVWVEPSDLVFTHAALSVTCKPDIGVIDRGVRYLLKLHYGQRPPTNERVAVVAQIMRSAMKGAPPDVRFGVLDLRRGKIRARLASAPMAEAIEEEAETFISYWNRYRPTSGRGIA